MQRESFRRLIMWSSFIEMKSFIPQLIESVPSTLKKQPFPGATRLLLSGAQCLSSSSMAARELVSGRDPVQHLKEKRILFGIENEVGIANSIVLKHISEADRPLNRLELWELCQKHGLEETYALSCKKRFKKVLFNLARQRKVQCKATELSSAGKPTAFAYSMREAKKEKENENPTSV
mmetsp:Transcript_21160/g.29344  ORF Transcript_21160/g.29344 Transcript_21160/m.29344 type:complete len:178 (-) Transcript_21160:201-734(-)